jgi:uncharacterized tellurite resistance protein B-like protein
MSNYTYLVDRVRKAAMTDARVNDFDNVELAAAVLLVNAAKMDGHISEGQREAVLGSLRRKFDLQDEQAEKLMDAAVERSGKDASLYTVANTLEEGMSVRQREELMGMVRDVIFADGDVDPLEMALLRQMGQILNVPGENPMAMRQRVATALGLSQEFVRRRKAAEDKLEDEAELNAEAQQRLANQRKMAKTSPGWRPPGLRPFGTGDAGDDL